MSGEPSCDGVGERHVLVAEDHEPTARLITTVVEEARSSTSAYVVGDGNACLAVLRGEDDTIPAPDLVLLDLDMPVTDGMSVLAARNGNPTIADIPTVVLSGQDDRETVDECYERGANACISKPGNLEGYDTLAEEITGFWLTTGDADGTAAKQPTPTQHG